MKWIKVEDKLPKPYKKVLVCITGDADPEIQVSCWDKKDEEPDEDGFLFVRWYYEGCPMYETSWYQKVTHWAKLPKLPKDIT
jgi:hypothetical protein